MLPEEVEQRFQRIDVQLELLARYCTMTAERLDRLTERVDALTEKIDRLEGIVLKTADTVAILVQLFDRHLSDGHGGR